MKLELSSDWADLYKKSTVIISAILAAITAVGPSIFDSIGTAAPDVLPEGPARWATTIGFLVVIIARYTHFNTKAVGGGS